jgi:two-component system response regulator GlrR
MQMVGESSAFRAAMRLLARIARFDVPALIEGETGTGKELAARHIHYGSSRRDRPFVPLNCGGLPESLIENELFGHDRGAYTDARHPSPGIVGLADALSPKAQVTLLRFLQDHRYWPVGGSQERQADIRLIAASNRPLARLCEQGEFRSDLFFRLNVTSVELPALRDREGDATLLARHFLSELIRRYPGPVRQLHPSSLAWIERYEWPGNVRELENVVQREFLLSDALELRLTDKGAAAQPRRVARPSPMTTYRHAKAAAVAAFDQEFLQSLLASSAGNVTRAAQAAGKDRRAFARLLRKYGIRHQDYGVRHVP